jgi:hypothetical protein
MPAVDVQCSLLDVEHVNLGQPAAIRLMLEERTVFPDSWVDPLSSVRLAEASFIEQAR